MASSRTGAEDYFAERLEDPEYRGSYDASRERISQIDLVIRALDARREELELSKAELARRAGVKPEAIRRLFSADRPNPTLSTLVALASALDLEFEPRPRRVKRRASTRTRPTKEPLHVKAAAAGAGRGALPTRQGVPRADSDYEQDLSEAVVAVAPQKRPRRRNI